MTTKKATKTRWPPGQPLPRFATRTEEERFWLTHAVDEAMEAGGEVVTSEPQSAPRLPHTLDVP